jgi:hypothetical protein
VASASARRGWGAIVLLTVVAAGAHAQDPESAVKGGVAKPKLESLTNELRDRLRKGLEDPANLNKVLDSYLAKNSGLAFLKDVNFRFKAFETHDPAQSASLGFNYDYAKVVVDGEWGGGCGASCARGYDFSFSAKGNVAFDPDRNPDDFLETKLSFALFQSIGGVSGELSAEGKKQYNELALKAAQAKSEAEVEKLQGDILRLVAGTFTDQYYVDLAGDFALESNQSFSAKQLAYGARLGLDVKGWKRADARRWRDSSPLAKLNVFDYPFALLRLLTGYDRCADGGLACFAPRGTHWPTAAVTFARIKPQDGDPRLAAGDDSDYNRLAAELSFKTPIAYLSGQKLFFSANHRLYRELDAAAAVTAAGLDHYRYTTLVIGSVTGPYLSYSNGRLPLDARNDQVFELGYQTHF